MKILSAAICDQAGAGAHGKLDLHGVFYDLYAPGFPAKQAQMTLVLVVEWDRGDHGRHHFRVDMVSPNGDIALTVEGHSDVHDPDPTRPPPRTHLMMPMEEVIFPVPGEYRFDVKLKGRTFAGPTLYLTQGSEADPGN
jgi:uncharacterized protein DUF6941